MPFETTWIGLGERWALDPAAAVRRIVGEHRGGYCFILNDAFGELLTALGYAVTRHVGGVHESAGADEAAMTNHLVLLVEASDGGAVVRRGRDGRRPGAALPLVERRSTSRRTATSCGARSAIADWAARLRPAGAEPTMAMAFRDERRSAMDAFAARHAVPVDLAGVRVRPRADGAAPARRPRDDRAGLHADPRRRRRVDEHAVVDRRADWFALLADEFGLTFEASIRPRSTACGASSRRPRGPPRPPGRAGGRRYGGRMTPDEFRKHGYQLIDWIADYLEHVETQRVARRRRSPATCGPCSPSTRRPSRSRSTTSLADLDRVVVPGLTHWQHPSFFAYFPGNSSYAAILGDLASTGLGVQGMSWVTSPACTEVETLMLDWMQELLGLPESFRSTSANGGGVIHGSASEATLASILAARWRATGGTGQPRRRHVQARCICNISGALQHREGFAHRRHRHRRSCAPCATTTPSRC